MMEKCIHPAARLGDIREYYFSRKLKEIARLNAEGMDIISLGVGGPDMPPPAGAVECAVETLQRPDSHGYQMSAGNTMLRRAFADWYARFYKVEGIDAERGVLPLAGSKEGIFLISMAYLNPGDVALVPDPGYPAYTSATRLAGGVPEAYPLSEDSGWMPDLEALEKRDLSRVKIMWVNYPHMPTGTPASAGLFRNLVDFGLRNGILIVNDNPYSFILNPAPGSIMQTPGALENCLELNSLSKCLNMAGWRVGVLIGSEEKIADVLKVKSNIDSGQPLAISLGAVAALSSPKRWYDSLNDEYERRKQIASKIMESLGCRCAPGQQGLFLWGRIPDSEIGSEAVSDRVLRDARVFVTPGFIFGQGGDRYIRISLCAPEAKLQEALDRINEL